APPPEPGPVFIALLLPLSGPSAALGEAQLAAAQLALFEIGSERLVLLPKDTGGAPEGAVRAVSEAVAEGASLILGPLFSTSVAAIAPLARAAGVNVVAFSSDRAVAGRGIFLMGFIPYQPVERVVTYAVAQGLTSFAALTPDTPYGREMVAELRRVAAATGAQVVEVAYYLPDDPDRSAVVRRLARYEERHAALMAMRRDLEAQDDELARRALEKLDTQDTLGEVPFNAVLLPDSGSRLRTVASYLPLFDVDLPEVRVVGTAEWEDPATLREPSLVGGWFAAPPRQARIRFEARFARVYGRQPPRLASLAYDAVALAGTLALMPEGPDFSVERLATPSGYSGVDGIFRFGPDGAAERGLAVFEVTAEGVKTVSPAPTTFEELGYY
ncbi:MAG: penicillin-binding protein activator, partial [Alphaproteobacteria bacterium]